MDRAALAQLSNEELRGLDELIEANGLEREQLAESVESVTHLEMFLHHYPRMVGIQLFPYLKSLSLINQVGSFSIAWRAWAAQRRKMTHGISYGARRSFHARPSVFA